MSVLRKGQVCRASDEARRLLRNEKDVRAAAELLRGVGLHAAARDADAAADSLLRLGMSLERSALDTFVAARRGEELLS
jgi:hypothetical protein